MEVKYVGVPKRFIAFLLDIAIAHIFGAIIIGIFAFNFESLRNDSIVLPFLEIVILLYFSILESSSRQATLGKAIMKIQVVNHDGKQISFLNALGRNIIKVLSYLLFGIPFLIIIFSKKKQALHDNLAKTYVVEIEDFEAYMQKHKDSLSTRLFSLLGFVLLGFVVLSLFASVNSSTNEFITLTLGGAIWVALFYGLYKLFKATGGDEEYLAKKSFANMMGDFRKQEYKVKQDGDITSSSHRTLQSAIRMTKTAKNRCSIYHKGKLLGVWDNGELITEK